VGIISGLLKIIMGIIKINLGIFVGLFTGNFELLEEGVEDVLDGILQSVGSLWNLMYDLTVRGGARILTIWISGFMDLVNWLDDTFLDGHVKKSVDKILNALGPIGDFIGGLINGFNEFLGLAAKAPKMPTGVTPGATGPSFVDTIMNMLQGVFGLANGGIVTRPTLAMIGEAGPEAVIPLSGENAGGFSPNVNITIHANSAMGVTADEIATVVERRLGEELRRLSIR
jgi:hypothetical protein